MIARNNVYKQVWEEPVPSFADSLTEEEVAIIQARTALKIYEPVCAGGEIVFLDSGDLVMNFGGLYAT